VFEAFKWSVAALSLAGVVLNVRKDRRCFYLWTVTNASWAGVDCWHGVWPQAVLQAVYCGLSVWGVVAWGREASR
jgi:nicotinamide riboside transporter PnuC